MQTVVNETEDERARAVRGARVERQGVQWRKLRYSAKPCAALFSGWNCVAKMLPAASAEVKRPP